MEKVAGVLSLLGILENGGRVPCIAETKGEYIISPMGLDTCLFKEPFGGGKGLI